MKRNKKVRYKYGVHKALPLFRWQECCMCHKEFRRERMFRALTGPFGGGTGRWQFVCRRCAPDKDRAHEIFHNNEWIPPKPKIPPPPPQRAVREGVGITSKKMEKE